jgi:hypothetical protein
MKQEIAHETGPCRWSMTYDTTTLLLRTKGTKINSNIFRVMAEYMEN